MERLIQHLKVNALLFDSPYHGLKHWQTVERNGLYLCQFNNADKEVVSYFAYTHDCMRKNEHIDPEHGPRAARFIKRNSELFDLNEHQMELLRRASSGHTHGRKCDDVTVMTCWDADRLDIGRVGIQPDSKYLFNKEAKRIADVDDFAKLHNYRL